MVTPLHCYNYDAQLKATLNHLVSYPQLRPFIGTGWPQQTNRVLLVAESHYLPEDSNGKSNSKTWYDGDETSLTQQEKGWINTRGVISAADHYTLDKGNFAKGHTIFYQLKAAIFDACQTKNKSQTLFQHFAYYNYFQRPAEIVGESIQVSGIDNRVAYNTIKAITEIAEPTAIIFVSKKAYITFSYWRKQQADPVFATLPVHHVPHPASPWWNRTSNVYNHLTGRARFIKIIKDMNYQLN